MDKRLSAGKRGALALVLAAGLLLGGCAAGGPAAEAPPSHDYPEWEETSGRVTAAETEELRLVVDLDSFNILVEDKRAGKAWPLCPEGADTDPAANEDFRPFLKSPLSFTYIANRNLRTVDAFTECIDKGQVRLYTLPDGVRVEYSLGDLGLTAEDLPARLTQARAHTLFLENSELSDEQKAVFEACYTQGEDGAWSYKPNVFGSKVNDLLDVFTAVRYGAEDLTADAADFGETVVAAEKIGFVVPVEYTLDGDGFSTRVPAGEIRCPEDYPILTLTLGEYFGAADSEAPGYILLPDGSGSLLRFDKEKHVAAQAVIPLYSRDMAVGRGEREPVVQPALLPVFGLKTGDDGFLAVVEKGDAVASLKVSRALHSSSYNTVGADFVLRAQDSMTLGTTNAQSAVTVLQNEPYTGDIRIRYRFLEHGLADYPDMARICRDTLAGNGALPGLTEGDLPFYLETVGAIKTHKNLLGINYEGMEPLTTFEQTGRMVEELRDSGVARPVVKLAGWMNGGVQQRLPDKVKPESCLGGKKGFRELLEAYPEIYPAVTFLTSPASRGLSLTGQAARTIDERYARTHRLDMLTNDYVGDRYILSPSCYAELTDDFLKSYAGAGGGRLCAEDLGGGVYADYAKNRNIDRQEGMTASMAAVKRLAGETGSLMLAGAGLRALPYAAHVLEAPLSSSGYLVSDEEVPFYPMVLHGLADYAGEPLNLSAQNAEDFLRAVRWGAAPYYKLVYTGQDKILACEQDDLYAVQFADWKDTAAQQYRRANAALREVRTERMTACREEAPGVWRTDYEGGRSVWVNFGYTDYSAAGVLVPARDFCLS